jgi:hypothetical protein
MLHVPPLQPMEQHAQSGQLPVQAQTRAPLPTEAAAHVGFDLAGEHLLLDFIDLGADAVRHPVHGVGDFVDELFQKRGDVLDAIAALEHAARRIGGAERLLASADQEMLGHRKAQEAGFLRGRIDVADEVGENAIDAIIEKMELLEIIVRQQQLAGKRRNIQLGEPGPHARVRQIEMQPQPTIVGELDRRVDRKLLGAAVLMQPKGPNKTRNGRQAQQRRRFGIDRLCGVQFSQHDWSGRQEKHVKNIRDPRGPDG